MGMQHEIANGEYRVFMIDDEHQNYITFDDDDMFYCGFRALGVALVR